MLQILIADDHGLIRSGVKQTLLAEYPAANIVEVADAVTLIAKVANEKWDIVITDIDMPGQSGLDALVQIKEINPDLPVLVLSIFREEEYALRVMQTGAWGYISKVSANEELVVAVKKILIGKKYFSSHTLQILASEISGKAQRSSHQMLSNREIDIMKRLARGNSIIEIAHVLSLATSTISTYRSRIMEKMGFNSNADLTKYALENKII